MRGTWASFVVYRSLLFFIYYNLLMVLAYFTLYAFVSRAPINPSRGVGSLTSKVSQETTEFVPQV